MSLPPANRRTFLLASAAMGWSSLAHAARRPAGRPARALPRRGAEKRLLVLGGTRFLGPQVVQRALDAGWKVTLFNRGRSNPGMFPELELRQGDRNEGHDALKDGEWDAVVDTSGYLPQHVQEACEVLKGRVGRYVFVSTISVYDDDEGQGVVDEAFPVGQVEPERLDEFRVIGDVGKYGYRYYGPLKALCEQAAEAVLPGQVASVRAGLIVGPEDSTDRFAYWPVRVHEGGEVLAPGDPEAAVQVIDVRDLGAFCFRLAEQESTGVMNAVGFRGKVSFQELLHGCKLTTGADCSFTWVPDAFLLERQVGSWMEMPLWIPGGGRTYANARAYAAGMETRPLSDTIRAALDWHLAEHGEGYAWRGAGLAREKEKAVLAAWHAR